MTELFFEMNATDISIRVANECGDVEKEHPRVPDVSGGCRPGGAGGSVKTLVLSHLIPADDPEITDQMWIAAAQSTFRGRVVLGKDLLEV
jgi:hypothetical protein